MSFVLIHEYQPPAWRTRSRRVAGWSEASLCVMTISVLRNWYDEVHGRPRRPPQARQPALLRPRDGRAQRRVGVSAGARAARADASAVPRDAGALGALAPLARRARRGARDGARDAVAAREAPRGAGSRSARPPR